MCRNWFTDLLLLTLAVGTKFLLAQSNSHLIVNQNSGIFTSPNYPAVYPSRSFELWQITVAASQRISLTIDPLLVSSI
ncbi:hypothetical protein EG68_08239 [Paragonimus skrjabini miyazakii]|uniref:CUB domain-containing protein n=1 Tax=Paragonimus skrjabini miyazakii TaxID=59628 RepID=A0A8S9YK79_9TREM|nr:hypothetical protein EG68_08239 [Paragonimus skrjabini miyazakii]